MHAWTVKKLTKRALRRLGEGDPAFLMSLMADDVEFRFPGQHPFAADVRTKEDSARWAMRFAHFRPQFDISDVVVGGPPWNLRAAIHFTDTIGDPAEGTPYVNEGVCWLTIRWGKVVLDRVFLDTQAVADFFGTESPEEFFGDLPLGDERGLTDAR